MADARTLARLARRPLDLAGKVVVVTGGTGGLGRALAAELHGAGARVALFDLSAERLAEVAASLGDRVTTRVVDVRDAAGIAAAVAGVVDEWGGIDVLINNAGVSMAGAFADCTVEQFADVIAINLIGSAAMAHAVLPHLPVGGHVLNVASMSGLVGLPYSTAYSASKFALRGFSESLSLELPRRGIGVTTVMLGGTDTGIEDNLRYAASTSDADRARLRGATVDVSRLGADKAARLIVAALRRRRPFAVVGADARAVRALTRVAPGLLRWGLGLAR